MQYHNNFLNKCLVESLLVNSKLLQIITIDLGNATQGFISIKKYVSMFNPESVTIVQYFTIVDPQPSLNHSHAKIQAKERH